MRVPVYDQDKKKKIGEIPYNEYLDYWDGHRQRNGKIGDHLGLGQLNGQFVLIFGSNNHDQENYGQITTAENVVEQIAKAGAIALLKKFPILESLYYKKYGDLNPIKRSEVFAMRIKATHTREQVEEYLNELRHKATIYIHQKIKVKSKLTRSKRTGRQVTSLKTKSQVFYVRVHIDNSEEDIERKINIIRKKIYFYLGILSSD